MVPLQRLCDVLCPRVFYGWAVVILVGLGMSCASPGHSFFFLNFVDSFISAYSAEQSKIPRRMHSFCSLASSGILFSYSDRCWSTRLFVGEQASAFRARRCRACGLRVCCVRRALRRSAAIL